MFVFEWMKVAVGVKRRRGGDERAMRRRKDVVSGRVATFVDGRSKVVLWKVQPEL